MRVGVSVGAAAFTLGGGAALLVTQPDGSPFTRIPAGEVWRVVPAGAELALINATGGALPRAGALTVGPAEGAVVRTGGRDYHGTLDLLRDRTGLTLVNRVGLEDYIAGVVGGEMGRRDSSELEALRAQAVASRTYALRNMGRWRSQGFDFYGTVADQVYTGVRGENPLARDAVADTRGMVLTYGGAPIDAFFFSTCGGHTATGTEAFRGAARPYLRSIADVDGAGHAYCSGSPRFRWREEWSGAELRRTLEKTLVASGLAPSGRVGRILRVRTSGRTESGRVAQLEITTSAGAVEVDGQQIRSVLRLPGGDILRSNAFDLTATYAAGQVSRLVADGRGAGHGVGMCQWGAVGRARAGQRFPEILAAYFPGTDLQRYY